MKLKINCLNFLRLIRPLDWIKNIFLFAPLFFTPYLFSLPEITLVSLGFVIFSFTASSIYILNDLRDRVADQLHPVKKNRPIASGKINLHVARIAFVVLSAGSFTAAVYLSHLFFVVLLGYYFINLLYCFWLKRVALLDIYCIASGFVLRVVAGAALIRVVPSVWILMCTGLLALFLALAKRRDDIVNHLGATHRASVRGYNLAFIDTSIAIALSALFIAYTIYATSSEPLEHLHTANFAWTVPIVLLSSLRYLQITLVEHQSGSPTKLFYTDRFLLLTLLCWVLVTAVLLY